MSSNGNPGMFLRNGPPSRRLVLGLAVYPYCSVALSDPIPQL